MIRAIVYLIALLVLTVLSKSLLLTIDVDLRESRLYSDWTVALNDGDATTQTPGGLRVCDTAPTQGP